MLLVSLPHGQHTSHTGRPPGKVQFLELPELLPAMEITCDLYHASNNPQKRAPATLATHF